MLDKSVQSAEYRIVAVVAHVAARAEDIGISFAFVFKRFPLFDFDGLPIRIV